ncbi:Hypothetical predicted protein, partial [Pelobates cultripes]
QTPTHPLLLPLCCWQWANPRLDATRIVPIASKLEFTLHGNVTAQHHPLPS